MVPASVAMTIWPPLTGKSRVVSAVAGATAVTVMPASLRAAEAAGLTTTSVLLPMTVARAEAYVILAPVPGLVLLLAAVPPVEVLLAAVPAAEVLLAAVPAAEVLLAAVPASEALLPLEPLLQAATTSPVATTTAIAGCRRKLRSKPISFLPRLVKADGGHIEVARALSLGLGHGRVLSSVCCISELTCTNWAAVG